GFAAQREHSGHLQQEGPSEASEDYRCAICLDNISNMACVYPCFHRFCTDCIQRWATTRPVCPLCRQPIDRHKVPLFKGSPRPSSTKSQQIPASATL
uniref:RING-type E3 ubiquitin transferase n=1 Tax=Coturnix japonica TaxID=93934 RepID=A0A8C2TFJ5_COTJA